VTKAQAGTPDVSICVVMLNWRTHQHTIPCLESVLQSAPPPAGIVLVENGSSDGSLDALVAWAQRSGVQHRVLSEDPATWPERVRLEDEQLVIIASSTNRGFSGGNNLAFSYAIRDPHPHYMLLLNNDTIVPPDYFSRLEAAVRVRPDVGLLSGTIYEWANPKRVWYAGGRFAPIRTLVHHLENVPSDPRPVPTDFVCGCAMLISPNALATLGGLAECYYPGYGEDTEYSWRAGVAGLIRLYAPQPVVYHKIGAAHGLSPRKMETIVRHRAYWARRNLRGWRRAAALGYLIITKPGRIMLEMLRGQGQLAAALARGTWHGLADQLPAPQWPEPLLGLTSGAGPAGSPAASAAQPGTGV
jgi:GT2 family glycosyltransferase